MCIYIDIYSLVVDRMRCARLCCCWSILTDSGGNIARRQEQSGKRKEQLCSLNSINRFGYFCNISLKGFRLAADVHITMHRLVQLAICVGGNRIAFVLVFVKIRSWRNRGRFSMQTCARRAD